MVLYSRSFKYASSCQSARRDGVAGWRTARLLRPTRVGEAAGTMRLMFRKLNIGQMDEKSEFQYETSCHT